MWKDEQVCMPTNTCKNNAKCVPNTIKYGYSCVCKPDFYGLNCDDCNKYIYI